MVTVLEFNSSVLNSTLACFSFSCGCIRICRIRVWNVIVFDFLLLVVQQMSSWRSRTLELMISLAGRITEYVKYLESVVVMIAY